MSMSKAERFLWFVQTAVLIHVNRLTVDRAAGKEASDISYTGNSVFLGEAIWASDRIPETMDASDAADEYCRFWFFYDRHSEMMCPDWFARH